MTNFKMLALILSAVAGGSTVQARTYFNAEFNNTMTGCVAANANQVLPGEQYYSNGFTTDGWTIERVGNYGLCAVSATHNGEGMEHCNTLTTPTIRIEEPGAVVRWKARSIYPGIDEAYSVYAQVNGRRELLFKTDAEECDWVTRVASLDSYAGQNIKIIIECTSVDRFMLAVDDLYIGVPEDDCFEVFDTTGVYAALNELHPITGRVTNIGREQKLISLVACVDDVIYGRVNIPDGVWHTGQTVDFELWGIGNLGVYTGYEVLAERPDGTLLPLFDGSFYTGSYERTLLLDYATDIYNNQASRINFTVQRLKNTYRGNIAVITTHTNADPLANTEYLTNIDFTRSMCMMLNRDPRYMGDAERQLRGGLTAETTAMIAVESLETDMQSRSSSVTFMVKSKKRLDNSADRYRIGYTITTDVFDPDNDEYAAVNGGITSNNEHYYFLSSNVPPELNLMCDVNVGDPEYALGIPGSLQSTLSADTPYHYTLNVDIPEIVTDPLRTNIVAYLIDTNDNSVLNAVTTPLRIINGSGTVTGDIVLRGSALAINVMGGNVVRVTGNDRHEPVAVSVYAADGRMLMSRTLDAERCEDGICLTEICHGPVIITAATPSAYATVKAIIR